MKKIFILLAVVATLFASCSKDQLNTKPTQKIGGDGMMQSSNSAIVALNGTYRLMYEWGQTVAGNYHQEIGPMGYALMADLMGEDMVMANIGSGWFWFDYVYNVKSRYSNSAWRPYGLWNFYYQLIGNVNSIIAAEETMQGPSEDVAYIIGQAYAIRAYCYHGLAVMFSRTYVGHESEKCVPIYTEPTVAGTQGNPRSTVEEVYKQINSDLDKAISLLEKTRNADNPSHMDKYVAYALKARALSFMATTAADWKTVADYAQKAQGKGEVCKFDNVFNGFNSADPSYVMWGFKVQLDQSTTNPQFMTHMDAYTNGGNAYGGRAPKCISKWLHDKIGKNDARQAWWNINNPIKAAKGLYLQEKFLYDISKDNSNSKYSNWLCDRIYMRIEEMVLTEAEALCRAGDDNGARAALNKLMKERDKSYDCSAKTGTALGALTTDETGSLLEEILIQRRIELWGEYGRIYDIKRLKQGFVRTEEMGHPLAARTAVNNIKVNNPETYDWVMTIPQSEFDANKNMDEKADQNPVDSGI